MVVFYAWALHRTCPPGGSTASRYMKKTTLTLADGISFTGYAHGPALLPTTGEVVFTTGMTGYVETLTDPSYAGQIIVFTYPLVGNYGVPDALHWESHQIFARGAIVATAEDDHSHYQSTQSLANWLNSQHIPLIFGMDTRAITKHLRTQGTSLGALHPPSEDVPPIDDPNQMHLVQSVSITSPKVYGNGPKRVIAVDCGMKENIVRMLTTYDITVVRVPYNYDYTAEPFDGIFLSNGPGDPEMSPETVAILKKAMALPQPKPIFGICLGSQMMGLAAGARTYKLPYGHRGQNQPCKNTETGHCIVTSQNHGFAIEEASLPDDWKVTHINIHDGSVEGIAHKSLPFFSVQFHPEAAPGPTDAAHLFDQFITQL